MSAALMLSKKIAEQAVFLIEQEGPPCYILILGDDALIS